MRMFRDGRPLKRWRYIGAYSPGLMLCAGDARIGPLRQRFWAVATPDRRIRERTALVGSGGLRLSGPELAIDAPGVRARLRVDERPGVETLSPHGGSYIWTSKQGGVGVSGLVELDGQPQQLECFGVVDDSAGYHARHTVWSWSAGVGVSDDGRRVAWNLVHGVHDAPEASERSVWLDGEPSEVGPVEFAPDLSAIRFDSGEGLSFEEWAAREDRTNALVLKSWYRQPFGIFRGTLPGGIVLAEGYGVMESHDVRW
jgi:uncharacterized protein DUF2804